VKRHEDRDTLIVRMFTDSTESHDTEVRLGPAVAEAWRVDLLERRQSELPISDRHVVTVPLRAHGIATLELALSDRV
jgi:hypothetical protein